MTKKIKMYLSNAQAQIKYFSCFLEVHADLQPSTQERKFQLIFVFFLLYNTIYSTWFSIDGSLDMDKTVEMYYKMFVHLGVCFSFLPFGVRSFISLTKAGLLLYKDTLKREKPLTGFFLGTTYLLWKYKGPIAAVCAGCMGGFLTINDYYYNTYGFSVSSEIEIARHGDQTWEQAKHHILNPYEYAGNSDKPYIQDLKKEICDLKVQLEEMSKK